MVDDIFPSYNYYADLGRKTSNTFVLSTQPKTSSTATVPNIVCDSCFAQHFLLSTSASLHSLYDVDKGLKSWPTFLAPQSLSLSCINENFFWLTRRVFFAHVTTRKEHLGRRRYTKETLARRRNVWFGRLSMISGNWSEQHE